MVATLSEQELVLVAGEGSGCPVALPEVASSGGHALRRSSLMCKRFLLVFLIE